MTGAQPNIEFPKLQPVIRPPHRLRTRILPTSDQSAAVPSLSESSIEILPNPKVFFIPRGRRPGLPENTTEDHLRQHEAHERVELEGADDCHAGVDRDGLPPRL